MIRDMVMPFFMRVAPSPRLFAARLPVLAIVVALATMLAGCATPGQPAPAATDARRAVVNTAVSQLGAPYRYAGADRTGFDASGLVHFAYTQSGYEIPREAEGQIRAGQPVRYAEARPADILFYRLDNAQDTEQTLHSGIFIGDGQMVHSSRQRDEVASEIIDNNYWFQRLVGVIRILP